MAAHVNGNKVYVTEQGDEVYGVMAEFADPAAVYHAAEQVRDAGYADWDVYSPFPIHGMEEAMGIKRTVLPLIVAGCAFTGAALGFFMQWWMNRDYPMVVQGKPYPGAPGTSSIIAGWEPFIPITFELGILSAAFAALIGMLALNKLPQLYHPLLKKDRFLRSSDDKFFIAIEAKDPKFDPERTRAMLQGAGAIHIELVEE